MQLHFIFGRSELNSNVNDYCHSFVFVVVYCVLCPVALVFVGKWKRPAPTKYLRAYLILTIEDRQLLLLVIIETHRECGKKTLSFALYPSICCVIVLLLSMLSFKWCLSMVDVYWIEIEAYVRHVYGYVYTIRIISCYSESQLLCKWTAT